MKNSSAVTSPPSLSLFLLLLLPFLAQSSDDLIDTICKATPFFDLCEASLRSLSLTSRYKVYSFRNGQRCARKHDRYLRIYPITHQTFSRSGRGASAGSVRRGVPAGGPVQHSSGHRSNGARGIRIRNAEENDGEPVDDLALMRRAYTNKKTGQIDDGLVRDVVDLVQTQVVDEVSQLQTEDDASTASTNLSRFRINEIVESSVPKKKGRLVGLGRRSRSAAPSSAPPRYVDPEVFTAQLKDKDDRISALETQMAAQQAGYEIQKRLNEQMMEMMKRMYPNEVFPNIQDP
ncbi:hypothetical protein F2Q70_00037097 [Brassica cretica]|uniref:Pectinesterase inhibitor domain-containing protein n=1 Tax=Brassica cretica TaxID=69181 RepID=A0A8S9GGA4_BRACR|nr:hypothetical protein F2Q68_00032442 [Brassica cretica]KAF2584010.1 hypothetical protein F2Q70_00037097 [Brassica cretica]